MRLIDADKLIKQFDDDINITSEFAKKSIKYDDYRDFDKSFAILYMLKSYRAIVEDMKTAFDVDKVLKQLSEKNRAYYERGLMYEKNGKISSALSINDRAEGIEIAYEIVKAGGIDE